MSAPQSDINQTKSQSGRTLFSCFSLIFGPSPMALAGDPQYYHCKVCRCAFNFNPTPLNVSCPFCSSTGEYIRAFHRSSQSSSSSSSSSSSPALAIVFNLRSVDDLIMLPDFFVLSRSLNVFDYDTIDFIFDHSRRSFFRSLLARGGRIDLFIPNHSNLGSQELVLLFTQGAHDC